jgi:hypothetical protein
VEVGPRCLRRAKEGFKDRVDIRVKDIIKKRDIRGVKIDRFAVALIFIEGDEKVQKIVNYPPQKHNKHT